MKTLTKFFLIIAVLLSSSISFGLVIHNQNKYAVDIYAVNTDYSPPKNTVQNCRVIEDAEIESYRKCEDPDPQTGKVVCTTRTYQPAECHNPNELAVFKFINQLAKNHSVEIIESNSEYQPKYLSLVITGKTGSIKTTVKNSCEMTVHNNGFMKGIFAEYGQGC